MARSIDVREYAGTVPGLHAALIEQLEADAAAVDPRIRLMGLQEMVQLCRSAAGFGKEVAILKGGDPDSEIVAETLAALRQEFSNAQPRAKSLRAGADKVRAGEVYAVDYRRALEIVGAGNFPFDVDELRRRHTETGRAPGVVVSQDDSVRLAEYGEQVH